MGPEGSLTCSQGPATGPYSEPDASIQIRGPMWHFVSSWFYTVMSCQPLAQTPSWRTTPCRLSAIAYSTHSQLPSVSGGRPLHLQPDDPPCRGDRDPQNMANF